MISIIIPVYNAEKTIKECIESLLKLKYPKYEIIFVDNNSTDKSAKIIKKYPVKYLFYDKVQSSYAARNYGIKHAKGDIIAFTDSDCIVDQNWLQDVKKHFKKNIGCVGGKISYIKSSNYVESYLAKKNDLSHQNNSLPLKYPKTANAFYKKKVFEKIGLFEESWISGGDADLCWRMQLKTKFKLKLVNDTKVLHKHRATLKSMFNQSKTWGKGSKLLEKKYPEKFVKRTIKQKMWILSRIILRSIYLIPVYLGKKPNKKELDYISFLGWEVGKY